MKQWKSYAKWPKGTIGDGLDVSDDTHDSLGSAIAVCNRLMKEGFGGERKIFPLRVWQDSEIDKFNPVPPSFGDEQKIMDITIRKLKE